MKQISTHLMRPRAMRGLGDGFTLTTTTNPSGSSSALGDQLLTLLLGVAIGAGAAGLVFSWKR